MRLPLQCDMGGVIVGNPQSWTIPITSAGTVADITVTPATINGYTPIVVLSINISHPLSHSISSYYKSSGNNWIFRIGSINGTTSEDSLIIQFLYIRNNMIS